MSRSLPTGQGAAAGRRLVRHQGAHSLGMPSREVEPDLRAATAAEDVGRPAAERLDQPRRVVAMNVEICSSGRPSNVLREFPRGS